MTQKGSERKWFEVDGSKETATCVLLDCEEGNQMVQWSNI